MKATRNQIGVASDPVRWRRWCLGVNASRNIGKFTRDRRQRVQALVRRGEARPHRTSRGCAAEVGRASATRRRRPALPVTALVSFAVTRVEQNRRARKSRQLRRSTRPISLLGLGAFVAVAVTATTLVASAPAAADAHATTPTEWIEDDDPELSGDPKGWYACHEGVGHGDNNCVYTFASAGDTTASNCATYSNLGTSAGLLEVEAFIPYMDATATVTYNFEYTDNKSGRIVRFHRHIAQYDFNDWTRLTWTILEASSLKITVCDYDAAQHHERDPGRSQIGIDAIRIRCVDFCEVPWHASPQILTAESHGDYRIKVTWQPGSSGGFLHDSYRVRYSRGAFVDHIIWGDREAWSSEAFIAQSNSHYSPVLMPGIRYTVEVWAVDKLGRETTTSFARAQRPFAPCRDDSDEMIDPDIEDAGGGSLETARDILDVAGTLEPTPFSDLLSGVISLGLGDLDEAGISAISLVPYFGDTAKVGKVVKRVGKFASNPKIAEAILKWDNPVRHLKGFKNTDVVRQMDALSGYFRRANDSFTRGSFDYVTDGYGRTKQVTGTLQDVAAQKKGKYVDALRKRVSKLGNDGDTLGHIGTRALGGPNRAYNLVPLHPATNEAINNTLEKNWANLVRAGDDVFVNYELVYAVGNNTLRPDEIVVTWLRNGHEMKPERFVNF